jgi:DNA-binding transcriptional regulator YdaS (Cro superfamily)
MEETEKSALERACAAANGSSRLAQLLTERGRKVSKASISRWKKERVPAEACPDIEAITGVKCEELRPDISWEVLRTHDEKCQQPTPKPVAHPMRRSTDKPNARA